MSFSLKIAKNDSNEVSELVNFKIWQRLTYMDDTTSVKAIEPILIPLEATSIKMRDNGVVLKQRNDKLLLYRLNVYNGLGVTIDRDVGGDYYFQFISDNSILPNIRELKKIEYSTNQNFAYIITNHTFQQDFTFHKLTNSNYQFFIQAENGTRYYEKTLYPFYIDAPTNSKMIVKNSLRLDQLSNGFYEIDGVNHFFDKNKEILPAYYIIKISI